MVQFRRAIRKFDPKAPFDPQIISDALALATLAPNSSNMQLWEFHRVKSPAALEKLANFCKGQNGAKTANELIVFVTTPHKWQQRAQINARHIRAAFANKANTAERIFDYYEKHIPCYYGGVNLTDYKGLTGKAAQERRLADIRVVLHKSAALAAMTFMYALTEQGYDSCPMEGFEEEPIKQLLNLDPNAEVCMVVGCGIRLPEGVYGPRTRVRLSEVIKEH